MFLTVSEISKKIVQLKGIKVIWFFNTIMSNQHERIYNSHYVNGVLAMFIS